MLSLRCHSWLWQSRNHDTASCLLVQSTVSGVPSPWARPLALPERLEVSLEKGTWSVSRVLKYAHTLWPSAFAAGNLSWGNKQECSWGLLSNHIHCRSPYIRLKIPVNDLRIYQLGQFKEIIRIHKLSALSIYQDFSLKRVCKDMQKNVRCDI